MEEKSKYHRLPSDALPACATTDRTRTSIGCLWLQWSGSRRGLHRLDFRFDRHITQRLNVWLPLLQQAHAFFAQRAPHSFFVGQAHGLLTLSEVTDRIPHLLILFDGVFGVVCLILLRIGRLVLSR